MKTEQIVRASFSKQAHWCAQLGSPFTARLLSGLGESLGRSTNTGRTILDWSGTPDATGDAVALRLAGALHALVRAGKLAELAELYPPNAPPSPEILTKTALAAITQQDAQICLWLEHAPQTNEVARSALLYAGMGVIARETNLPLSIFEAGASAGLNLMMDRFAYRFAGRDFGNTGSAVNIAPQWNGPMPGNAEPQIIARRGCDLNPLDLADPSKRARLMAYIWPDQQLRLARAEAAIEIALREPPKVDRADAGKWVEEFLPPNSSQNGRTRVLFHSIAYQYFPENVKSGITQHMEQVGADATPQTPLAWLAFEQIESLGATLTLRLWHGGANDGEMRVLAKASNAHVHGVEWL